MNKMSYVVLSIDIIEYIPNNFNFDDFGFVFINDSKDFQEEINFINKNQILYKAPINRRDIKFSVKVTKSDSLIGICDFTVPFAVIARREISFEKQCPITMTESTKRLLFGGLTSSNILKVTIHAAIQYIENNRQYMENNKGSVGKSEVKSGKRREVKPDSNRPYIFKKPVGQSQPQGVLSPVSNSSSKFQIKNNKKYQTSYKAHSKQLIKPIKKENKEEINNIKNDLEDADRSLIDEEVKQPIPNIDKELIDFFNRFVDKNPLEKLNDINDAEELQKYTKDIINQLLEYQLKYYDKLKQMVDLNHRLNELLLKYNEKYRNIIKQQNRLNEQINTNEMLKDITNNIYRGENDQIKKILPIKTGELNFLQEIYGIPNTEEDIKKAKEDKNNNENIKKYKEKDTQNLLIKVMQNVISKNGPVSNLLNSTNSTEEEILNINKTLKNLNIINNEEEDIKDNNNSNNKENEDNKEKYVISDKYDEYDKKLENFLVYFYSKRNFPVIPFIKRSTNNYTYGTQKIILKFEGMTIRVRYIGGYVLLDKFIELNAAIEEAKLRRKKKNNSNGNKTNSGKKNIKK